LLFFFGRKGKRLESDNVDTTNPKFQGFYKDLIRGQAEVHD